jgi:methionine-rich copper-binding protein CopC
MYSKFLFGDFTSWFRWVVIPFIIMSLIAGSARVVLAHSELISTEPEDGQIMSESPEEVWAWFSEELDSQLSQMRIFDSQNHQIDNNDGGLDLNDMDHMSMVVSLPSSLPEGTYTVHWTAASAEDEDLTEGNFNFMVGSQSDVSRSAGQSLGTDNIPIVIGFAAGLLLLGVIAFVIIRRRSSTQ